MTRPCFLVWENPRDSARDGCSVESEDKEDHSASTSRWLSLQLHRLDVEISAEGRFQHVPFEITAVPHAGLCRTLPVLYVPTGFTLAIAHRVKKTG